MRHARQEDKCALSLLSPLRTLTRIPLQVCPDSGMLPSGCQDSVFSSLLFSYQLLDISNGGFVVDF